MIFIKILFLILLIFEFMVVKLGQFFVVTFLFNLFFFEILLLYFFLSGKTKCFYKFGWSLIIFHTIKIWHVFFLNWRIIFIFYINRVSFLWILYINININTIWLFFYNIFISYIIFIIFVKIICVKKSRALFKIVFVILKLICKIIVSFEILR